MKLAISCHLERKRNDVTLSNVFRATDGRFQGEQVRAGAFFGKDRCVPLCFAERHAHTQRTESPFHFRVFLFQFHRLLLVDSHKMPRAHLSRMHPHLPLHSVRLCHTIHSSVLQNTRMNRMAKPYRVKGKVWVHPGEMGAWHFVAVDKKQSVELKEKYAKMKRGFGSLRVRVTLGKTKWDTSIFPEKRSGTYLLPLKASVRRAEDIGEGDIITFTLEMA